MTGKDLKKVIQILLLIFLTFKKKEYFQVTFQNLTLILKKKMTLLMIPDKEKEDWHYLAVKNYRHYCME